MWRSLLVIEVCLCLAFSAAGQFKPAKYYSLGGKSILSLQVVSADFNNDGIPDLAVADALSNKVSVLLGKNDGGFDSPILFSVHYPINISSGDMNGDGNEDLIVTSSTGTGNGEIEIFLGDGTGRFGFAASYEAGFAAGQTAVADFNGDGNLDVAIANFGNDGRGQSVMVFLGDGTGGLGSPMSYALPGGNSGGPTAIATADLNGDGFLDLAVTVVDRRNNHLPYVAVILNDGRGKFKLSGKYRTGGGTPDTIAIANLKGYGQPDIAVGNKNQSLGILLNKGQAIFGKAAVYPSCHQCGGPNIIAVADFNQDGVPDIACVGNLSQKGSNGIFYGAGQGKFTVETSIPKVLGGAWIISNKFGHDKAPDLAISTGGDNVAVLINKKH